MIHVAADMPMGGRLAFAAVFAAVILIIALIPNNKIGIDPRTTPVWKNVRYYAIVLAIVQMLIYLLW